ncbi:Telomerase Cajal body protein 1 [Linum perenne]
MGEEIVGRSDSPGDETAGTLTENGTDSSVLGEVPMEAADEQNYSYWPSVRFDVAPHRTYHFSQQFRGSTASNNFLKGVKWSPDGSCFLSSSEDNKLRLFSLPDYYDGCEASAYAAAPGRDSYGASMIMDEGEPVYDFCWYPYMASSDPVSCVFATTTRDHPIHLWDATSGSLRCTYRAYDAVDEITAAISVAFNPAGTKIYAGYNKCIRVFNVHRPGRDFVQHSTLKGNKEGQTGVISSIAFSPHHGGMLATGSFSQSTAIYREDNMELLYLLHGQEGGITHVQFSNDGNYLYTGGRKDPYIMCWDVRKAVEVVYKFYRSSAQTNQRIYFDLDPHGRHLGTGGQDGLVHIYDLQTGQWISGFQAATDTVNGFAFHPSLPMAVSSSGHRRFQVPDDEDDNLPLTDDENCVSVWSFSCGSTIETGDIDETLAA